MAVVLPEVTYRQDTAIWPVLEDLSACLCSELAEAGLPETCFCGILPGEVATDYVGDSEEGMAWVRVVAIFPSTAFPTQQAQAALSCQAPLAAELEVGVMRCAPPSTDNGMAPPTMAAQWEASRLQMADMAAVRRAVQCCYSQSTPIQLGRYVPVGPMGGVVGGLWQVFVGQSTGRTARHG